MLTAFFLFDKATS